MISPRSHIINKSIKAFSFFANPSLFIAKREIPVFMFHRILNYKYKNSQIYDNNIFIRNDKFEEFILHIRNYYNIIPLNVLLGNKYIPNDKSCIITFDDGWLDNYQIAFPILKKHSVPATIFLPTGLIGTDNILWFERLSDMFNYERITIRSFVNTFNDLIDPRFGTLEYGKDKNYIYYQACHLLKKMHPHVIGLIIENIQKDLYSGMYEKNKRRLINWEEVSEMSNQNISFGSHGVTHSIFTRLNYKEKYYEIVESKNKLINKTINYVNCLSFPNGDYDQETLDISVQAGYSLVFSASINKCGSGKSPILAHRICVSENSIDKHAIEYYLFKAKIKNRLYKI